MVPTLKKKTIDHDNLFKELLFHLVFFPEFYSMIDFSQVEYVEQELVDFPGRAHKRADRLIKTTLVGDNDYSLFIIEHQSQKVKTFAERLFVYYSSIYKRYRCNVIPIAVFGYKNRSSESGSFVLKSLNYFTNCFRFHTLLLRNLSRKDYIDCMNPAVAPLLSTMYYKQEDKIHVKLAFYKILLKLNLDPAKERLVCVYFETYLTLSQREEDEFYRLMYRELSSKEVIKMEGLMTEWEMRGYNKAKGEIKKAKDEAQKAKDEAQKAKDEAQKDKDEAQKDKDEILNTKEKVIQILMHSSHENPKNWRTNLEKMSLKDLLELLSEITNKKPLGQLRKFSDNGR